MSATNSLSISTHVLDAALGAPAADVLVVLERRDDDGWIECDRASTNDDGRVGSFGGLSSSGTADDFDASEEPNDSATAESVCYRLTFDTGTYFAATGQTGFYPEVSISFTVSSDRHYHVPVLLSPFAFSTYRGS